MFGLDQLMFAVCLWLGEPATGGVTVRSEVQTIEVCANDEETDTATIKLRISVVNTSGTSIRLYAAGPEPIAVAFAPTREAALAERWRFSPLAIEPLESTGIGEASRLVELSPGNVRTTLTSVAIPLARKGTEPLARERQFMVLKLVSWPVSESVGAKVQQQLGDRIVWRETVTTEPLDIDLSIPPAAGSCF